MDLLRTSKGAKNGKKLTSLPVYDMLQVFDYTQAFFYE